jgi:hypothetical protein
MKGSEAILRLSFTSALALAAACGKSNSLADAPGADSNRADAANTIDADQHGPVTVIALDPDGASGPEAGVQVAFLEPTGVLAAEVTTDANGKATADVLPGASVTAVYVVSATQHALETVTGVKPGDTITIGDVADTTPDGTFTVNLIDVLGTSEYDVYGPCGAGTFVPPNPIAGGTRHPNAVVATDPVTISLQKGCETSTMDLVAVRLVAGVATDYVELAGVPYVASGSVTQTASWTPVASLALDVNDIPTDVTTVNVAGVVPDDHGFYASITPTININDAQASMSVPLAHTALLISTLDGTRAGEQQIYDMVDGTKTSYALDAGAALLPWVDPPVLDAATGKLTTASTGGNGPGDAFEVDVSYQRPGTTPVGYVWTVWSASIGDVTLPTLPTDLADNSPQATDTVQISNAFVFDLDLATGYDAVRPYLDSGRDAYYDGRGQLGKLRTSYSVSRAARPPRIHVAHKTAAAR